MYDTTFIKGFRFGEIILTGTYILLATSVKKGPDESRRVQTSSDEIGGDQRVQRVPDNH